jgi:DNA repair photolyase
VALDVRSIAVRNVLTRTSGYLRDVCSHSLQPYRGCAFGRSLCGVGCYVQHNRWVTEGRPWGRFLEVREGAADSYRAHRERERRWARRERGAFSVFLSSSTEPFPPQERRHGATAAVLEAMAEAPPDELIVQTHGDAVRGHAAALRAVAAGARVRVHLSIESDRETLPGLPPPAASVARRFEAAEALRAAGLRVVVTVAPLLPIDDPDAFFARVATSADAVVIDHFVGGDGSPDGARTRRTALPAAMEAVVPGSTALAYRDRMVAVAARHLPGRVGVGPDGFAGRFLRASPDVPCVP